MRVVFVVVQASFEVEDGESNQDVAESITAHGLPDRVHLDWVLCNVADGVSDRGTALDRECVPLEMDLAL